MRSKPSAETTLGVDAVLPTNSGVAKLTVERRSEAGEPTGAREHVCGPGVILTASVKGAREISAGRSPLAKQVARAVRARQNHAGGVPANCGSGEQVGRRPQSPLTNSGGRKVHPPQFVGSLAVRGFRSSSAASRDAS